MATILRYWGFFFKKKRRREKENHTLKVPADDEQDVNRNFPIANSATVTIAPHHQK